MRTALRFRSLVTMAFLAWPGGFPASAAPAGGPLPTPMPTTAAASQHVTAPSLPGQPNREGVVQPGGGLRTDEYGNVTQPIGGASTAPTPANPGRPPVAVKPRAAAAGPVAVGTAGPAPTGPGVETGPNVAHIRGVVKAYEAGKSLTMTVRGTGRDVTYRLKAGATVPPGLKPGDAVRIRALAAEKGKVIDGVEVLPKP